jgi:hypothetical protein
MAAWTRKRKRQPRLLDDRRWCRDRRVVEIAVEEERRSGVDRRSGDDRRTKG